MCMLATIVLRITAAVGLLYAGWHGLKKIGVEYPGISCWNASRLLGVGRSNHRDEGIYVMIPKVYNAMRNGCYLSGEWLLGGRLTQMLTHLEVGEWLQRCTHALTRLEWLLNQHVCHAVLLLSLLLAIAIAYRWFTKDTEKPKNVGSVATTPARNLSPFTATERSAFSPARYTSSSSWFVGDDDDDSFPIRPRTLRDVMLGSTWEDGEPYSGGLHEREAPSVSSTDSSRSFESPSEVAYHTLTDDADAQDVSDSEDGAVYELRRQQAAARVIQDWTRTGFQQWLQERGPRLTDVPLRAAPENSLDEDFGAVFPTIADSSEIGATLMWQPGRQSSEDDLPGGSLAVNVSPEKDMAEEHVPRSNLGAGKSQSLKADPEMTKIPESNVSENDVAWSSDETTYARFPSRLSPSGSPRSSISPEDGNGVDSNDGAHAQQLFVQLPEPLPRTPVDQLLPGPSSEKIFGELLRECKHGVPLTFEAMLEDIGADGCVKLCEGGVYTEVFRTCGTRGGAVLKVLHPAYLVRHLNLVLTEVRIARSLRSLSMDVDNNTRGFAELRAVYAVWDKYPEVMVNACVNYHSRKNFSLFSDEERDLCRPYVVLYMSHAGRPLNKVKFQSALQIRSVVQQVALTLAAGEAALEFEHRALTPAHVLVNEAQDQVVPFVLNGRALLVHAFGVQVSIVDFSAARMTLAGQATDSQPVYADLTKLPARKRAALGDTFAMVYHFISEDLSRFHPWTNMEYLEALTRTLVNAYDRHFAGAADEEERRAWRDVCFWLAEMPHWGGARPFALELVAPSLPFTKASTSTSRQR
ncbi:uncharacterized protein [Dermacentor albipictus]|uniref:uncharacterized protein isoform X1 n=1 Tax=Dermacentor albipictus TaxID=60249 RepID=UPI0031FE3E56